MRQCVNQLVISTTGTTHTEILLEIKKGAKEKSAITLLTSKISRDAMRPLIAPDTHQQGNAESQQQADA
ncbi:MAG TPA: hypothetical protein VGN34_32060 [Ktedonobacteraceae bacterium]